MCNPYHAEGRIRIRLMSEVRASATHKGDESPRIVAASCRSDTVGTSIGLFRSDVEDMALCLRRITKPDAAIAPDANATRPEVTIKSCPAEVRINRDPADHVCAGREDVRRSVKVLSVAALLMALNEQIELDGHGGVRSAWDAGCEIEELRFDKHGNPQSVLESQIDLEGIL